MRFDLLLKGGHLIDQPSGYDGVLDLAVKRHRIAAVAADIPAESTAQVLDLSGQYVVPGLVDLHSHVYRGATAFGIDAENLGSRTVSPPGSMRARPAPITWKVSANL